MKRIDAHQHYWTLSLGHNDWPPAEMKAIHRDFGPDDLKPELSAGSIEATVLVQAAPNLAETRFLLQLAEKEASVAAVVGWVDVEAPSMEEHIAEFKKFRKFKGIRPMLQGIDDTLFILQPHIIANLEMLPALDLRFDALVQPRHLPVIAGLADRLPDLAIVVDHAAKPFIAAGALEPWRSDMAALAQRKNVTVKLSGLVTEAGGDGSLTRLKTYSDHLIDVFGPDRMMFGSDWPVVNLDMDYLAWWELAHDLMAGLNVQERASVFGGTAARFYGIAA